MLRQKYSDKVNWLGKVTKEKTVGTYQGKYLAICKKCPTAIENKKIRKFNRKNNFIAQVHATQIEDFKASHDNHNWTLIHISRTAKYIQKQMIGGKICQVVTL